MPSRPLAELCDLPDELLIHTLLYLDRIRDIVRCQLVRPRELIVEGF
jgi:hypothetical protein